MTKANDPPWLAAAFNDYGLREIDGPRSNARITEMYRLSGVKDYKKLDDSNWSWCSAAMNAWRIESGGTGTKSLMGRSWLTLKNSTLLDRNKTQPRGAIAVFRYDNDPNHGHVAIVLEDKGAVISVIGANQNNSVSEMNWSRSQLIGAVWPNDWPMPGAGVPKPKPKPVPKPEAEPEIPQRQPDDPGPEPAELEANVPWYRRLWLRWFGGGVGSYLGLAGLTDWQIALVLMGGSILTVVGAVGFVLIFIGANGRAIVRDWIIRQFRQ